MIYLLSNGKQLIIAYGNPNLREYSILARSIERLDMQSLFVHLKKHSTCQRSQ